MPDCNRTGQCFHQLLAGEVVSHVAKTACIVEALVWVVGYDTASFLTPVLQGMQAKGHKACRISNANRTKYAAFFAQFIVVEGVGRGQLTHGRAPIPVVSNPAYEIERPLSRGRCYLCVIMMRLNRSFDELSIEEVRFSSTV